MSGRLEEIIDEMPPGMDRAVLRVLEKRNGKAMAIQKAEFHQAVKALGFGTGVSPATLDRQVRMAVASWRKQGVLICSSSGDGGYFLAATRDEFDEFIQREIIDKIVDMSETKDAMIAAAIARWGEGLQMGLGL